MAGIGLFNFDIDAKSVEPLAVLAVCGVAGYFLWKHLAASQAAAASASDPANVLTSEANTAYENDLQMAELQGLFGGGASVITSTPTTTTGTTTTTATNTGASTATPASTGTSSEVGSSPAGTA